MIDPLSVPLGDFVFEMRDPIINEEGFVTDTRWALMQIDGTDTIVVESSNTMLEQVQQVIPEWGLAVNLQPIFSPASERVTNKDLLT